MYYLNDGVYGLFNLAMFTDYSTRAILPQVVKVNFQLHRYINWYNSNGYLCVYRTSPLMPLSTGLFCGVQLVILSIGFVNMNFLNLRSGTGSTSMRWDLILTLLQLSSTPSRNQHSITMLENPKGLFDQIQNVCIMYLL